MFCFLHGCRRTAASALSISLLFNRSVSRISIPTPPPFPVVEKCPSPTCQCQDMPEDLEIDRDSPLNGTIAAYAEQILISTGRRDWKSRIEEDEDAVLIRELKKLLGRGGKFSNPFHNVMITASSFTPHRPSTLTTTASATASASASAFLLPSFTYLPSIPLSPSSISTFLQAFVLPIDPSLHHSSLPPHRRIPMSRRPALQSYFPSARPVDELLILVCGHMARDRRCGVLAPILEAEFRAKLAEQGVQVVEADEECSLHRGLRARIGAISHIGGHKFAGNVIVYIPPVIEGHALRGKGVWYGRVEPKHVEGIVRETVLKGKIIRELFRGGVGPGGEVLRL